MDPTELVEIDLQLDKNKKCLDRWMENLPEEAHTLPLHCLAIPGKSFADINMFLYRPNPSKHCLYGRRVNSDYCLLWYCAGCKYIFNMSQFNSKLIKTLIRAFCEY